MNLDDNRDNPFWAYDPETNNTCECCTSECCDDCNNADEEEGFYDDFDEDDLDVNDF